MIKKLYELNQSVETVLNKYGQDIVLLFTRIWIAKVFFLAGKSKIQSWESTKSLFEYEYSVPLLPPVLAAYIGTFVELFFPILLVIGLCSRWSAIILFVFNIVAVISYWEGVTEYASGLEFHILWGALLAVVAVFGPGRLSIDHLIGKRSSNTL